MPLPSASIPNQDIGDISGNDGNVLTGSFRDVNIGSTKAEDVQDPLRSLKVTDPRIERIRIAQNKDDLLEGSCAWVFEDAAFTKWWEKDDTQCLWIHGDPGKGKTMLAMAVINEITGRVKQSSKDTPGGYISYFFCQGAIAGLNDAISVLQGLIYILIDEHPELVDPLRRAIRREGSRMFKDEYGLLALWGVLQKILEDKRVPCAYLVIDALDECSGLQGTLLNILTRNVRDLPKKVKWIVTSRNVPQIRRELENNPLVYHTSLELNSTHVTLAVREFIRVKVKDLKYDDDDLLRTETEAYLTAHADGTFLWVALVCQGLRNVARRKVRSILYRFPSKLEPLYDRMLEQIEQLPDSEDREYCIKVLRITSLAYRPLHLKDFAFAADLPDDEFVHLGDVSDIINQCGSFLTIRNETVYFVHQSAKDFLSGTKDGRVFPKTQKDEHQYFASRLLRLMSQNLKRNICGLEHSDMEDVVPTVITQHLSGALEYACQYWIDHLDQGQVSLDDEGPVHRFLQKSCLYWLEAMSLVGKIPQAIAAMMKLESLVDAKRAPELLSLLRDILRFMLTFSHVLAKAPLQLYSSGLAFSPSNSIVRRLFGSQASADVKIVTQLPSEWNACTYVLEGHSGRVDSVAFSPNGSRVASGSADRTVRVWDVQTGLCQYTLKGHKSGIRSVVFSPDTSRVVSGSDDNSVRVWHLKTGQCEHTLKGHSDIVTSVVFSPDGSLIASSSADDTVRVWDMRTGQCEHTLEDHLDIVTSVVFSPDGSLIASSSGDHTVRLWNVQTGLCQFVLEGHTDAASDVVFSPDGLRIASGSHDNTVRLWDVQTGQHRRTFEGHSGLVWRVAFSPDGSQVASGSKDQMVRLWDVRTGQCQHTLEGHSEEVVSVTYSPDGSRVVSGSTDQKVHMWDVRTGQCQSTLRGHSSLIVKVVFSPDGSQVASGSGDHTVRVWDVQTSRSQHELGGHSDEVTSVEFSPDGSRVASGSWDRTVRVWDAQTGQCQYTFEAPLDKVQSVAWHPNGLRLASGAWDRKIRVWDLQTGQCQYTLKGPVENVWNVVSSPDGLRVASGGDDHIVRVWDVQTGLFHHTLEGHSNKVNSVVFSPDGSRIASASDDGMVQVFDLLTGQCEHTLKGHSDEVYSVVFSPDGLRLASGSDDSTVRVWDVQTGLCQHTLEGHSDGVSSVIFSPDGSQIASGSDDSTIRVWDIQTGLCQYTLEGHSDGVNSVVFSPNGSRIASASDDGTVRVWDIASTTELLCYKGRVYDRTVKFSDDGTEIVVDGTSLSILSGTPFPSITTRSSRPPSDLPVSGLEVSDDWVTLFSEKILWLPSEYRPGTFASHRDTVAIGSGTGRVTFVHCAATPS